MENLCTNLESTLAGFSIDGPARLLRLTLNQRAFLSDPQTDFLSDLTQPFLSLLECLDSFCFNQLISCGAGLASSTLVLEQPSFDLCLELLCLPQSAAGLLFPFRQ